MAVRLNGPYVGRVPVESVSRSGMSGIAGNHEENTSQCNGGMHDGLVKYNSRLYQLLVERFLSRCPLGEPALLGSEKLQPGQCAPIP